MKVITDYSFKAKYYYTLKEASEEIIIYENGKLHYDKCGLYFDSIDECGVSFLKNFDFMILLNEEHKVIGSIDLKNADFWIKFKRLSFIPKKKVLFAYI
jgi:hypothetical protein